MNARAIIDDRFQRWRRILRDENATPLMVLGLQVGTNVPVITTCDGMPNEQLIQMLELSAALLRKGGG